MSLHDTLEQKVNELIVILVRLDSERRTWLWLQSQGIQTSTFKEPKRRYSIEHAQEIFLKELVCHHEWDLLLKIFGFIDKPSYLKEVEFFPGLIRDILLQAIEDNQKTVITRLFKMPWINFAIQLNPDQILRCAVHKKNWALVKEIINYDNIIFSPEVLHFTLLNAIKDTPNTPEGKTSRRSSIMGILQMQGIEKFVTQNQNQLLRCAAQKGEWVWVYKLLEHDAVRDNLNASHNAFISHCAIHKEWELVRMALNQKEVIATILKDAEAYATQLAIKQSASEVFDDKVIELRKSREDIQNIRRVLLFAASDQQWNIVFCLITFSNVIESMVDICLSVDKVDKGDWQNIITEQFEANDAFMTAKNGRKHIKSMVDTSPLRRNEAKGLFEQYITLRLEPRSSLEAAQKTPKASKEDRSDEIVHEFSRLSLIEQLERRPKAYSPEEIDQIKAIQKPLIESQEFKERIRKKRLRVYSYLIHDGSPENQMDPLEDALDFFKDDSDSLADILEEFVDKTGEGFHFECRTREGFHFEWKIKILDEKLLNHPVMLNAFQTNPVLFLFLAAKKGCLELMKSVLNLDMEKYSRLLTQYNNLFYRTAFGEGKVPKHPEMVAYLLTFEEVRRLVNEGSYLGQMKEMVYEGSRNVCSLGNYLKSWFGGNAQSETLDLNETSQRNYLPGWNNSSSTQSSEIEALPIQNITDATHLEIMDIEDSSKDTARKSGGIELK